ncbi:unnamed protein product [Symbiodinium natans]|uniref:Uncharacterized protein n=1 Tax=Symbiodinium natans TaxID=878477 RepID=A0A812Q0N1_9DINO|nr:unnamed protein product [Symbiodinium natans]
MDPAHRSALKQALGIAVELVFHGSVIVNGGKPKRVWSQVRPLVQDAIRKGIARSRSVMATSTRDGVAAMASECARESLTAGASNPGERSVALFMTEKSAEAVRKWLAANGSKNHAEHSAFCTAMNKLSSKLCKCRRDTTACPIHSGASVTIPDLVWWSADAIYESVPCAVPTFAVALAVRFAKSQQPQPSSCSSITAAEPLPAFCQFLCCKDATPAAQTGTAATDADAAEADVVMVPNNAALEALTAMRPAYLLTMIPKVLGALSQNPTRKCRFADCQAQSLQSACNALLKIMEPANAVKGDSDLPVSTQLEMLLATMVADETDWATGWSKLLTKTIGLEMGSAGPEEFQSRLSALTVGDLGLDVPAKFKYMLGRPDQPSVKDEVLSPGPRTKGDAHPGAASEPFACGGSLVRLSDVYVFTGDVPFNVLDVLSIQMQISTHLYAKALSASDKHIMDILYIDYAQGTKAAVTIDLSKVEDAGDKPQPELKIWMFGQVVTDMGPKNNYPLASGQQHVIMLCLCSNRNGIHES